jgi:hypothetical protein
VAQTLVCALYAQTDLKETLNKFLNVRGFIPSLWEGLGEGAKLDAGAQALSPTLSQREREKANQ